MKRQLFVSLLSVTLLGVPMLVGCDRTIAKDETVKTNSDGSQTTSDKTVTKNADGTTTVTQEQKKTPPANP